MNIQLTEQQLTAIETAKKEDAVYFAEKWDAIYKTLSDRFGAQHARNMTDALKEMSGLYTHELADWYAGLYDARSGGWYYANSARDTEGYLPDIESTYQALGFLKGTGIFGETPEQFRELLPTWIREGAIRFAKSLQAENGFFYHPQWGREMTDKNEIRRGRDVGMAMGVFTVLGGMPTYNTPSGQPGDGIRADGSRVENFVPAEVTESGNIAFEIPEHLTTRARFLEYLNHLENKLPNFYSIGNAIEAQATQIAASDALLKKQGKDEALLKTVKEWFDSRQNPDTGLWVQDGVTYVGINSLLKVGGALNRMGLPIEHADKALNSIMEAFYFDKPQTVCYFLNPWYALSTIRANSAKFSTEPATARKFEQALCEKFPELVHITANNMKLFRREDYSFGMAIGRTTSRSQGMPVAVEGTNDGDINASHCARSAAGHVFASIGLNMPPICGKADRLRSIAIMEDNKRKAGL